MAANHNIFSINCFEGIDKQPVTEEKAQPQPGKRVFFLKLGLDILVTCFKLLDLCY